LTGFPKGVIIHTSQQGVDHAEIDWNDYCSLPAVPFWYRAGLGNLGHGCAGNGCQRLNKELKMQAIINLVIVLMPILVMGVALIIMGEF
jgi:hypothetical protein